MQMHIQTELSLCFSIHHGSFTVSFCSLSPLSFFSCTSFCGKKGAQKSKCEVLIHLYYFLLPKVNVKSLENTEKIGNNIPKKEDGEISHWQKSM